MADFEASIVEGGVSKVQNVSLQKGRQQPTHIEQPRDLAVSHHGRVLQRKEESVPSATNPRAMAEVEQHRTILNNITFWHLFVI